MNFSASFPHFPIFPVYCASQPQLVSSLCVCCVDTQEKIWTTGSLKFGVVRLWQKGEEN